MMAAATAEGRTVLTNAAQEPEVRDLGAFLEQCGAKVRQRALFFISFPSLRYIRQYTVGTLFWGPDPIPPFMV